MTEHDGVRSARAAVFVLALCAGVSAAPTPGHAQTIDSSTSSPRPYRTLFGGAGPQPQGPQSLILNVAGFAGYDDNIFARGSGPGSAGPGGPAVAGTFLGSQATLAYQRQFATASLSASAATANRWVTDTSDFVNTFAAGGVALSGSINPRTNYVLRQSAMYRPYFTPVPFPPSSPLGPSLTGEEGSPLQDSPLVDTPDDYTIASDRESIRFTTYGGVRRRLTPRSTIASRAMYSTSDFASQELATADNNRWLGGLIYSYDMTRYLSAQLGYTYRSFNTSASGVAGNHDLNIGLNYNRPFTVASGRTVLSFSTGSTILKRERLEGQEGGDRFTIRAIGTANLAHSFSATWQGNATYAHSVGYMDGFTEPVEGDQVTVSIGGLLAPALDFSMGAGYMSGAIGLSERNFDTATASARLRYALHSRAALFAQYFYYQYAYADGVADQVLPASELRRQGFRAGVNLWLPLMR